MAENSFEFGHIRNLLDRTARIQVCMHDTGSFISFYNIEQVPSEYDNMAVEGIGLVDSYYHDPIGPNTGRNEYAIEIRLFGGDEKTRKRHEAFSEQIYTCKECGKKYTMRVRPEDKASVSPILWQRYEQELCDECFTEWYKNNKLDD